MTRSAGRRFPRWRSRAGRSCPPPPRASSEQRSRAAQGVLAIIAAAESEISRAAFISRRPRSCSLPGLGAAERPAAHSARAPPGPPRRRRRPPAPVASPGAVSPEHDLLRLLPAFREPGQAPQRRHTPSLDRPAAAGRGPSQPFPRGARKRKLAGPGPPGVTYGKR